ncbi:uncharacterized protein LY89DRAFT_665617 [Mollisia scopiformis]|uniref:Myb-like domain-containing protein n=1 Tax=Mollisia scopiformis TaxID=149040 RepID=A0A194XN15_MOLSC|nr:uncharacterized protein LY89DRAFT_665617 [Mollisia scopiformis]KUJ21167.1 hypothetical protein LY89DRAFT_665617 [Mollisia scopiformis]
MFINAEPRFVSNGFETFVPSQRTESLHQRLVEMTNNDVNAWSVYRPAAPPAPDTWDQHLEDFGSNENFSVQPLYGAYFQNVTSGPQNQVTDMSKTASYTALPQGQNQRIRRNIAYQDSTSNMNCSQQQSPMLGHDYAQLSLGRGRGSFAEFSNARHVFKDFKYHPSTEATYNGLPSTISDISTTSYSEDSSGFSRSMDINRTSPDTVYNSYSLRTIPAISQMSASASMNNTQQTDARAEWWPGSTRSTKDPNVTAYDLAMTFDSLGGPYHQIGRPSQLDSAPPYHQIGQRPPQLFSAWSMTASSAHKWISSTDPTTISPKALTLNTSCGSLASSGSSQASMLALSEASTTASVVDGMGDLSSPENLVVVEPQPQLRRPRQILPDSGPSSERIVPVLRSQDIPSGRNASRKTRKRSVKAVETESHARRSSSPSHLSPTADSHVEKSKDDHSRRKKFETKLTDPPTPSDSVLEQPTATLQAAHHREAKDDFLIKSKLAGMSYKEIRKQGKFTEAESTLRGRYRTLTKHKTARVRKPEWNDNDLRLLKRAVRKLSYGDPSKSKVPWKQVADYISNNGGSYHFGNATCRKQWDELQESG